MIKKYLDNEGLIHLWSRINEYVKAQDNIVKNELIGIQEFRVTDSEITGIGEGSSMHGDNSLMITLNESGYNKIKALKDAEILESTQFIWEDINGNPINLPKLTKDTSNPESMDPTGSHYAADNSIGSYSLFTPDSPQYATPPGEYKFNIGIGNASYYPEYDNILFEKGPDLIYLSSNAKPKPDDDTIRGAKAFAEDFAKTYTDTATLSTQRFVKTQDDIIKSELIGIPEFRVTDSEIIRIDNGISFKYATDSLMITLNESGYNKIKALKDTGILESTQFIWEDKNGKHLELPKLTKDTSNPSDPQSMDPTGDEYYSDNNIGSYSLLTPDSSQSATPPGEYQFNIGIYHHEYENISFSKGPDLIYLKSNNDNAKPEDDTIRGAKAYADAVTSSLSIQDIDNILNN